MILNTAPFAAGLPDVVPYKTPLVSITKPTNGGRWQIHSTTASYAADTIVRKTNSLPQNTVPLPIVPPLPLVVRTARRLLVKRQGPPGAKKTRPCSKL